MCNSCTQTAVTNVCESCLNCLLSILRQIIYCSYFEILTSRLFDEWLCYTRFAVVHLVSPTQILPFYLSGVFLAVVCSLTFVAVKCLSLQSQMSNH